MSASDFLNAIRPVMEFVERAFPGDRVYIKTCRVGGEWLVAVYARHANTPADDLLATAEGPAIGEIVDRLMKRLHDRVRRHVTDERRELARAAEKIQAATEEYQRRVNYLTGLSDAFEDLSRSEAKTEGGAA